MMEKKTILVVDDELFNREDIEEDLIDEGYNVTLAADGAEALAILLKEPKKFNVVLLDRMMPNMSGMDLLGKMRSTAELRNIPVIFQTAKGTKEDIVEGLNAGAYYYLIKPFKTKELLAVTKTALLKQDEYIQLSETEERSRTILRSLSLSQKGEMEFFLQSVDEAVALSKLLCHSCPVPTNAYTVLYELLVNGIEHGNLEISYDDKSLLQDENRWNEEVEHRLTLEKYKSKKVILQFQKSETEVIFSIQDEGKGFDWEPYMDFSFDERAQDSHGRGIAMSNHSSGFLVQYHGNGNLVTAQLQLTTQNP